jgi:hypothetical protein
VPSIPGRLVTNQAEAERLPVPQPGDRRTGVYLETVRRLRQLPDHPLVLGGSIGSFSRPPGAKPVTGGRKTGFYRQPIDG